MQFSEVRCAGNWHKVQIGKSHPSTLMTVTGETSNVYINVKDQICSLAPVFTLEQLPNVFVSLSTTDNLLKEYLGLKIDTDQLKDQVLKIKKQLPLSCETPLIDEDLSKKRDQTLELESANSECFTHF